jgi:hypothetical protein
MRQLREATKVNADNRWAVIIVTTICVLFGCEAVMATEAEESPQLLDLSGLAWIGGDRFLSVSDAKNPREDDLNRVGLLTLPDSLDGLGYESTSRVLHAFPGGLWCSWLKAPTIMARFNACFLRGSVIPAPDSST